MSRPRGNETKHLDQTYFSAQPDTSPRPRWPPCCANIPCLNPLACGQTQAATVKPAVWKFRRVPPRRSSHQWVMHCCQWSSAYVFASPFLKPPGPFFFSSVVAGAPPLRPITFQTRAMLIILQVTGNRKTWLRYYGTAGVVTKRPPHSAPGFWFLSHCLVCTLQGGTEAG